MAYPITGPRARNHEDAERLKREAQGLLDKNQAEKRKAALTPAGTDMSKRNLEKAKGWTDGSAPGMHSPSQ
jgi:hypothetical protein